jgi:Protein of unknown function (DUF1236)
MSWIEGRVQNFFGIYLIASELSSRMQVRLPTASIRPGSSIMPLKFFTSLLAGTALIAGVVVAGSQEHGRGMGGGGRAIHQAPSSGGWAGGHGGGFSRGPGMSMQGRGIGGGGPAMHQAPSGSGWGGGHGGGFSHEPGMSMQGRAGGQIGGFNQPRSFGQGTLHGQHGPGFAQHDGMRGEHFGNRSYGVRSGTMNENRGRSFGNERGYNRQTFSDQHRFAGHDFRGTDRMGGHGFGQAGTHGHVALNHEKLGRIRQVALHRGFISRYRVSDVDFDVAVGVRVPRHFHHFFVVPEEIVLIEPAFADDYCFVYEDELVIVDPVTFEIIAIIPV